MPARFKNDTTQGPVKVGDAIFDARKAGPSYRVILEGIDSEVETPDSFAIKFSIACKVPVTKVKHMLRALPATVWMGQSRTNARRLVALISEAGGRGRLVEEVKPTISEAPEVEEKAKEILCRSCGFPLKKDDKFCGFCMTPVVSTEQKETHVKVEGKPSIPLTRLLFYLALVVALIIIALALR